jgi:sterol desaturase/sphingolipid hydroxylase (fatty acid hydroxylase superfamily)
MHGASVRQRTDPCARADYGERMLKRTSALFSIEHGSAAYAFDFALYGVAVLALAAGLTWLVPLSTWPVWAAFAVLGWGVWTLLEYAVHRFILHGVRPFNRWHLEHHHRPTALICAPTVLSVGLIVGFFFLPLAWGWGVTVALALTLGLTVGYLAYAVLHHATHHWRARGNWLKRRKLWHAQHHRCSTGDAKSKQAYFGVSSSFWDHVFRTDDKS